jgi:nucleoside-diphosphate-sugar epimerase
VSRPRDPLRRVAVTGASGFIGGKLVAAILERGVGVVALSGSSDRRLHSGVVYKSVDVSNAASMLGAFDGCDTVVHLAGLAHKIGQSLSDADFDHVNVEGTRNALDEASRSKAVRFLFVSSALVGGSEGVRPLTENDEPRPADAYARSKLRAEKLVRERSGDGRLWTAIVRPPMVYGPGNRGNLPRLASLIRKGIPLPFGAVSNSRSVVSVENLVHAILILLEQEPGEGDIFYVADDSPLSTAQLAREIGLALGTRARIIAVPKRFLDSLGRVGDLIAMGAPFPVTSREINKLTGTLVVDDSKLRRLTGYTPLMTTSAGIREAFGSGKLGMDAQLA